MMGVVGVLSVGIFGCQAESAEPLATFPIAKIAVPSATAASPAGGTTATAATSGSAASAQVGPTSVGPCAAVDPAVTAMFARGEATPGGEPAKAEAVRLRLEALWHAGCHRALDVASFRVAVSAADAASSDDHPSLFAARVGEDHFVVGHGDSSEPWVALYGFRHGKVRTLVLVRGGDAGTTGSGLPELDGMTRQLLLLDYAVLRPTATQPLLVVANTHPWVASCWRTLRFRVLAPSGDPLRPDVLVDEQTSGRWCEPPTIATEGDDVHFDYFSWGGPWTSAGVWRPYRRSYRYERDRLVERFGYARTAPDDPGFVPFAEDWIQRPWTLAAQATTDDGRATLEATHRRLRERLRSAPSATDADHAPIHSAEVFPTPAGRRRVALHCTTESKRPCAAWPTPVDVVLERRAGAWLVADVTVR